MARNTSFTYYILYICIGFLYPAYCSLIALQTPDKKDDTMWLIYWVVFALLNVAEVATDLVLFWFPLYPLFKLLVLIWCNAPFFHNGSFYLYKIFIGPFFRTYGEQINVAMSQIVGIIKDGFTLIRTYNN